MAQPEVRRYYATPVDYSVPILIEAWYEQDGGCMKLVHGSVRYLETEETSSFPGFPQRQVVA